MRLINCKEIREQMLTEAREKIASIPEKLTLAIISAGDDDASKVYIKNKIKTAESVGILTKHYHIYPGESAYDVATLISRLNDKPNITGIMLQLPLRDEFKPFERDLLDAISWDKDVDGLTSTNVAKLWLGEDCITPATPTGILRLLPEDLSGKAITIVNRSNLIGKPLAKLLLDRNATVQICHSKTDKLKAKIACSDYVITGIGKPKYFKDYPYYEILSPTAWIDCGINRDENGKLCGDVDIDSFKNRDVAITPVPGGVGTLTTAQLMLNVIKAYELQRGK